MHAATHALLLAEQEQTARAEVVLLRSELAVESRAAARARGGMPGKFVRGQETLTLERNTVATLELCSRVNEEHALEETVTQLREEAALHRKALSAALAAQASDKSTTLATASASIEPQRRVALADDAGVRSGGGAVKRDAKDARIAELEATVAAFRQQQKKRAANAPDQPGVVSASGAIEAPAPDEVATAPTMARAILVAATARTEREDNRDVQEEALAAATRRIGELESARAEIFSAAKRDALTLAATQQRVADLEGAATGTAPRGASTARTAERIGDDRAYTSPVYSLADSIPTLEPLFPLPNSGYGRLEGVTRDAGLSSAFASADAATAAAMVDAEAIARRARQTFAQRHSAFEQQRRLERLRREEVEAGGEWRSPITTAQPPRLRRAPTSAAAPTPPRSGTRGATRVTQYDSPRRAALGEWQQPPLSAARQSVPRGGTPPSPKWSTTPTPAVARRSGGARRNGSSRASPSPAMHRGSAVRATRSSSRVHIGRHGSVDVYPRGRAEPTTHIDRYGSVDLFAARVGGAGAAQSAAAVGAAAAAAKRDVFASDSASAMSAMSEMSDAQRSVARLLEGSIGGSSSDSSERGFSPASMASEFDDDGEVDSDSAAHDNALVALSAARAASARDARDSAVFSSFDEARALLRRQIARVPARWDDGSSSSTS
jgi:hypothetical protein